MNGLICAVCPTFNRPELLPRAIRSFEKQTYENRYLIVIDDLGQYENQRGDRWELISVPRFKTLGEKRNFGAAHAPRDTWAYAVWDDDDLYMPWHLEGIAEALHRGEFVQPRHAVDFWYGNWVVVETFKRRINGLPINRFSYHGCWAYTKRLFDIIGGYPKVSLGDDQDFQREVLRRKRICSVGTDSQFQPSYFYNRPYQIRISETWNSHRKQHWANPIVPYIGKISEWADDSEWDREIPKRIIERPWK